MATVYWDFTNSAWGTDSSYHESSKITSWSSGSSDSNNSVLLQYRVYSNNTNGKIYLQFRVRTKNKSFTTTRNGYLCNGASQYGDSSTYYIQILHGSTSVYKYAPAQVTSAQVSTSVLEKLPKIKLSSSGFYNHTASEDGSSYTSPVTVEVTSYAGQAIKAYVRLSWCRIYTVSGVKYIEWDNMRSPTTITLCTLPTASWAVSYNANGHGTAPSSQTKYANASLTLRSFISNVTTGGTKSNYTITGNASANGGTWSGSNGSASYTTLKHVYSQTYWNTNSSGTGTNYSSSGSYTANAGTTLYAIWKDTQTAASYTYVLPTGTPTKAASTTDNFTVTFNANGGTTTKTSQSSSKPVTYSFKGWFTAASGGTQRTTSSHVTASETVYAQFNSTTGSQTAVTLPTTAQCTRDGYELLGFSTSDTATTATYLPGASYTPTSTIVLYAVWVATTSVFPKVYINGAWRDAVPYVYVGGVWKEAKANIRVGGEWKE
jgi:hypothetical protein